MLQAGSPLPAESSVTEALRTVSSVAAGASQPFRMRTPDEVAPYVTAFLESSHDLVCFSHLRWDFVYQRPQHLLSRFARHQRLFFCEEPHFSDHAEPRLNVSAREDKLTILVPHLPHGLSEQEVADKQRTLYTQFFLDHQIEDYLFWYYTPMAMAFTSHFTPKLTVFDCMDELSAFDFAPPQLKAFEAELFRKADLVFTGGQSLYESKKQQHARVYPFPSSIDIAHFAKARSMAAEPADQAAIKGTKLGFYGVIDERMDLELLRQVAAARPDWHLVLIGPVVKIDPAALPQLPNLHYLGGRKYEELPAYLSGWDVALLPFAINRSTEFISPTKTPEYLAGGKPVVSTPIRDVVRPYGDLGLVQIARTADEFVTAIQNAMAQGRDKKWRQQADAFLANLSWDLTWKNMVALMQQSRTAELSN